MRWPASSPTPPTSPGSSRNHPEAGTFTLNVQAMQIEGTPGHRLVVYHAEPGTPDHDAIVLLDQIAHATTPQARQHS